MSLKLEGDRELQNLVRELPKRVNSKAMRQALTLGSTPILKAAKAKAPRDSGTLRAAMGRKIKANTTKGRFSAIIGARKGMAAKRGRKRVASRYLHLVEKGRKASNGHPGTTGTHFLEESYNQNKATAERLMADRFKTVIETEARKLGRR